MFGNHKHLPYPENLLLRTTFFRQGIKCKLLLSLQLFQLRIRHYHHCKERRYKTERQGDMPYILLLKSKKQRLKKIFPEQRMSSVSFLEFQYKLSRNKYLRKPSRLLSSRDRQSSRFSPTFQPDLKEMKQVFDKFDCNKDGKISPEEYKATLRALGQHNTTTDVLKIFQVVDLDGDGYIDFEEFVEAQKKGGGVRTTDIESAFQTFDANGDGKITAEEVMEVLRRIGESCSLSDCRRMVKAVDVDGDGMVNMDEFMTMMTRSLTRNEG